MNVYSYFEPLIGFHEDEVIALWKQSWSRHGWTPVILSEGQAQQLPFYIDFAARAHKFPTINPRAYELACYRRWAAMAVTGGLMVDYDVMNYGWTPAMATAALKPNQLVFLEHRVPSGVLGDRDAFTRAARFICDYKPDGDDVCGGRPHVSDMTIMQKAWGSDLIHYEPIIRQYNDGDGWEKALLIHYPNAKTCGPKPPKIREHPSLRPSRRLMVVLNVGNEDEICKTFLPYWQKSGCDLMFSSPLNAPSALEGVKHVRFGRALTGKADENWFYQSRVLDTMKYCLGLDYDAFLFTQYDSIALGHLPEIGTDDCVQHLCGGDAKPFKSSFFVHPPYCFGKNRLRQFVEAADKYPIETTEFGVQDRWLSLILEEQKIPWQQSNAWTWSANAIDTPELMQSARNAVKNGIRFFHGVKNAQTLNQLLAA